MAALPEKAVSNIAELATLALQLYNYYNGRTNVFQFSSAIRVKRN
jgi:hypothetical protein